MIFFYEIEYCFPILNVVLEQLHAYKLQGIHEDNRRKNTKKFQPTQNIRLNAMKEGAIHK